MITSVTLGGISLSCSFVNKPQYTKTVKIPIPGREADLIQNLGKMSKEIELRGVIKGAGMESDRTTLLGFIGTTQSYVDSEESFTMYVDIVTIPTEGGYPNHYNFVIRGYKYEQT